MAIGVQFSAILTNLRAETRRSTDVSVNVDDNDSLKRSINGVYRTLAQNYDWPHLRVVFPKITLSAGQRYYDYQTGFNPDRVLASVVWLGSTTGAIERGVDFDQYGFLDSDADQRADPVQRWDTAFDVTSGKPQIELWPIPASDGGFIQFEGYWEPQPLVADSDPCLLDDELVLLFAAARQLGAQGAKDTPIKLSEAQGYLLKLQQRGKAVSAPAQMGLSLDRKDGRFHPKIVVKPSSPT